MERLLGCSTGRDRPRTSTQISAYLTWEKFFGLFLDNNHTHSHTLTNARTHTSRSCTLYLVPPDYTGYPFYTYLTRTSMPTLY